MRDAHIVSCNGRLHRCAARRGVVHAAGPVPRRIPAARIELRLTDRARRDRG